MTRVVVRGFVGGMVLLVLFAAILFAIAGRRDLPFLWAYLGVYAVTMVVGFLVLDPGLIEERIRPGPGGRDYATVYGLTFLWILQIVVAALDVGRFHWSDTVPPALQGISLFLMAVAMAVVLWAESVNRFFSAVIRIQTERGHRVVTGGPYRYVRHPGYATSPFLLLGGGLVLGSWLAALIGVPLIIAILRRTALEDRILHEQLEGYAAYARRVRYRVFPGIW